MPELSLRLLGGFEAEVSGESVAVPTRKARALLAYLAMKRGGAVARETAAALLWSRSAPKQAAASLNQAVYSLRKAFEAAAVDAALVAEADALRLPVDGLCVDVWRFEDGARGDDRDRLAETAALFRGPFLEGFAVSEPEFDDWASLERSRLGDVATAVGSRWIEALSDAPSDERLAAAAAWLLQVDPLSETAYRALMLHHAERGAPSAALAHFERLRAALDSELGVEPAQATVDLRRRIQSGAPRSPRRPAPAPPEPPDIEPPGAPIRAAARRLLAKRWRPGVVALFALIVVGALLLGPGAPPADEPEDPPAPQSEPPRLLVPPFRASDQDADAAALGAALSEELTTELATLDGLEVVSRATAFADVDWTPEAARRFGVGYYLEGVLWRSETRTTLNLRLVDAETGVSVWSERVAHPTGDALALRDRAAEAARAGVAEGLGLAEPHDDAGSAGTVDAVAYDLYLAGLAEFYRRDPDANARAARLFTDAIARDPAFADARAGLAKAYYRAAFQDQAYADALRMNWMDAYLAMSEQLRREDAGAAADAWTLRARLALRRRDFEGAIAAAESALDIAPGDSDAMEALAEALVYSGDWEQGAETARRALRLNPAVPQRPSFALGLALFAEGRPEEAADAIERAPGEADADSLALLAAAYGGTGRLDDAERALAAMTEALEDRPKFAGRRAAAAFENPRRHTWWRPSLAETVDMFPFTDPAALERLAAGLVAAGAPGETVGYLSVSERDRVGREAFEERLSQGLLIYGRFYPPDGVVPLGGAWRPFFQRLPSADARRPGDRALGPGQVCEEIVSEQFTLPLCGSIFRLDHGAGATGSGAYVMFTELGPLILTEE